MYKMGRQRNNQETRNHERMFEPEAVPSLIPIAHFLLSGLLLTADSCFSKQFLTLSQYVIYAHTQEKTWGYGT